MCDLNRVGKGCIAATPAHVEQVSARGIPLEIDEMYLSVLVHGNSRLDAVVGN